MLAEGGNALEAMVAMAATIAAVYPHMNHVGGDGFWLIREPRAACARSRRCGPGRREARRASSTASTKRSRRAGRWRRSPCRARSAAGRWRWKRRARRRQAAAAMCCSAPRSSHARDGYTVTRSQAALTRTSSPNSRTCRASRRRSCRTASRRSGRGPQADGVRRDARTPRACRPRRLLSRRCRARDRRRPRAHRQPGDARRPRSLPRVPARAAVGAIGAGTLYNMPPPTQGLASLMILALFERLRCARPRASNSCTASSRRPSARSACATRTSPIRPAAACRPIAISTRRFSMRGGRIDRAPAARWPRRPAKGDTVWMGAADSSGLVVSYIQSIYWEFGSGCVLPAPAC
jgi:oxamate amidohydrolase